MKLLVTTILSLVWVAGCGYSRAYRQASTEVVIDDGTAPPKRVTVTSDGNSSEFSAGVSGAISVLKTSNGQHAAMAAMAGGPNMVNGYGYNNFTGSPRVWMTTPVISANTVVMSPTGVLSGQPAVSISSQQYTETRPATTPHQVDSQRESGSNAETENRLSAIERDIGLLTESQRWIAKLTVADCQEYLQKKLNDRKSKECLKIIGKKGAR